MSRQAVTKPAPTDHEWFQSGSAPNKATPSNGQIDSGYTPPAIPKLEEFNFWMQKWDQLTRYYISRGLPDWDAAETYQVGDVVRYTSGGVTYLLVAAVTPTVALNPLTNLDLSGRQWERWMVSNYGSAAADTVPTRVQKWGNHRSFPGSEVDHLGYIGGIRALTQHETWRGDENVTSSTTLEKTNVHWGVTIVKPGGSASQALIQDPSSTITTRSLGSIIGGTSTDEVTLRSDPLGFFADQLMFEANVVLGANVDGQVIAYGLSDTTPGPSGDVYGIANTFIGCVFRKAHADTNWQAICGDGSARTIVDTGVAASANGSFDLRIEAQSAAFNDGVTAQVRFYLNNALVATITTHLPFSGATKLAALILAQKRDTGTATRQTNVKHVRFGTYAG